MGGWLLLMLANWAAGCLTGCCAPLQLLLLPHLPLSSLSRLYTFTRWQGILGSAASSPAQWKCPVTSGYIHSPGCCLNFFLPSTRSSLHSVFIFVHFLLLYTTWPLQCDIPTCHLWERLLRQPWTPPVSQPLSLSLSLPFIFFPLPMCVSVTSLDWIYSFFFFFLQHTQQWCSQRESVYLCTVQYDVCVTFSLLWHIKSASLAPFSNIQQVLAAEYQGKAWLWQFNNNKRSPGSLALIILSPSIISLSTVFDSHCGCYLTRGLLLPDDTYDTTKSTRCIILSPYW